VDLPLCKECFCGLIEKRVRDFVEKYKILNKKIAIGMSGGVDSGTLAFLFKKLYKKVPLFLFHLNLGIGKFSEDSQKYALSQAKMIGESLNVFYLKKMYGIEISDIKKVYPRVCAICGSLKRYLFNKIAFEANCDIILTAHHLDDFLPRMLRALLHQEFSQFVRMKPFLEKKGNLVAKAKPLYKVPKQAIEKYAIFHNIPYLKEKCPMKEKNPLKKYEKAIEIFVKDKPLEKYNILSSFLKLRKFLEKVIPQPSLQFCKKCGFLSANEICGFCARVEKLKKINKS